MAKVLTVLVPVYNTEKYIKRCLDSLLLKEVLDDIEVLTVSDGSKDNSANIIKEYIKKYPNTLRLIEKENGGHGSTINVGIENGTGKYFRVVDSDDWVNCKDFIEFVRRLKKEDADVVVTNYHQEHIYNEKSIFYKYDNLEDNKKYIFDKIDLSILKGEYFVMATSTYKLSILRESKVHLLEKTFYVDMQYNIESMCDVNSFRYYDLDIYRYYIGRKDQSVNKDSFARNAASHDRIMRYLVDFYTKKEPSLSKNKKEYIKMILVYMLNTHYTIYFDYRKDRKESYKEIKAFDKYFKKTNIDLYNASNIVALMRVHRKYNFIFVKIGNRLFRKAFSLAYKLKHR